MEFIQKVVKGGISKNEIAKKFDILPNTLGAILKKGRDCKLLRFNRILSGLHVIYFVQCSICKVLKI